MVTGFYTVSVEKPSTGNLTDDGAGNTINTVGWKSTGNLATGGASHSTKRTEQEPTSQMSQATD